MIDQTPGKGKKIVILILALALLVGTVSILGYFYKHQQVLAADRNGLNVTGTVEARTVMASFKVAGKIENIMVEEGDEVQKGQELAALDSRELEAKVMQAQGACEAAQGQLIQAGTAVPLTSQQIDAKITQAQAVVDKAEVGVTNAGQQLERVQALYAGGAVSKQQLDQAQNAYDAAVNDLEAAQGQYDEARSARLTVDVAESQCSAASGLYKQAQGALAEAQAYLDNTVLTAPISGYITGKMLDEGEMLNAGTPVFEISDLKHTYVSVFVDETKIGLVKLGQEVDISVDAYPDQVFIGNVVWISDAGQFAVKKAVSEQDSHDIRSFEVKIDVPNDDLRLKTGMTATAAIINEGN